jgi:hypothetical protein
VSMRAMSAVRLTGAGTDNPIAVMSVVTRRRRVLGPSNRNRSGGAHFLIQLVESEPDLVQYFTSPRCQAVHAWSRRPLGLGRAQPAPLGHAREHRIQSTRTQSVPVVMQFFEHPLAIHALFVGVMQDMNLPEREEKFTDHRIAHG